jgi:tetratricopeptide (TPR) repeat protein
MDQNRWKIVADIFHAAVGLPDQERAGFIVRASGGDEVVEKEVEALLHADALAKDYIEAPIVGPGTLEKLFQSSQPLLVPGETLCGRFRILRAVGEGGMGQIFEAYDIELAVHVALKTIRAEIAANPQTVSRFRQEVRLARRITHPNVCRTFDLERDTRAVDPVNGSREEIVFLTMEFLEGESLAARIKREGALALEVAFDIARQLASGLQAARVLGVVHRDIKPGNIMLVSEDSGLRAVITDFGLAYAESVDAVRTLSDNTAMPLGTLAYMAPEQLEGHPVSPATDTYAFGLVLFEMITGKQAFPPNALLSGIARRLSGQLPDATSIVPGLPARWTRTISACLEVRPEDRPRLEEVVDALATGNLLSREEGWQARMRRTLPFSVTPARLAMAALGVFLVLSLFWAGFRYSSLRANPRVEAGALVYLAPVRNETDVKLLDNSTELFRAGLAQSARINLLDIGSVGDTLQRMGRTADTPIDETIAREIAMRTSSVRVVFVVLRGSRGKYELDVDIQQPDNTPGRARKNWQRDFPWRDVTAGKVQAVPVGLLNAARDASDWVRIEVGEAANDLVRLDVPLEDVTTRDWAAYEDYAHSTQLAQAGQVEAAEFMLEHAVATDPNFALAWGRMGDLLVSLGRDTEGYRAYDRALDAGGLRRLTRREEDRIRGMRAVDKGDYELAVQAFHDYMTNYPNDSSGWTYPLRALRMLGRDEVAVTYLRRAISIEPNQPFAPYQLALELIASGRQTEATKWEEQLRRSHSDLAERIEVLQFKINLQYDAAERIAEHLVTSSDPLLRSFAYEERASLLADQGMYEAAISVLEKGMSDDIQNNQEARRAWKLVDRAYLEARLTRMEDCLTDTRAAIHTNNSPWLTIAVATVLGNALTIAPADYHRRIIEQLVRLGDMASGSHDIGSVFDLMKLRVQGELELARGNPKLAVATFGNAATQDAPAEGREYLARALFALAQTEASAEKANADLEESMNYYALAALRPAFIWFDPSSYLPGYFGDQLEQYVNIATKLNLPNPDVARAEAQLKAIRQNHNPGGAPTRTNKGGTRKGVSHG